MSTSYEHKLQKLKEWRGDFQSIKIEAIKQDEEEIVYLLEMVLQQISQQISESKPIGLQLVTNNQAVIK